MIRFTNTEIWDDIISKYSPAQIELWGTVLVQIVFFWIPCIVLLYLDKLFPSLAEKWRIKDTKSPLASSTCPKPSSRLPANSAKISYRMRHHPNPSTSDCLLRVLSNQSLLFILHFLNLHLIQSPFLVISCLPSLCTVTWQVLFCLPFSELIFYYVHRALHTLPWLYKNIHKTHHRFIKPVSFSAQFAHPLEFLIGNVGPVWMPLVGLSWVLTYFQGPEWRVHITVWWVLWGGVLFETAVVHSGYAIFGREKGGLATRHDLHHEVGRGGRLRANGVRRTWGNFGTFAWVDQVHGTEIRLPRMNVT